MSIAVVCPKCSVKLNAPDGAAGKKVKCPKCQAGIVVPEALPAEFEVVEDEPRPATAKPIRARPAIDDDDEERPRKKKRRDDDEKYEDRPRKNSRREDDDEEEDDEDRPRKKKRRRGGDDEGGVSMTRNIVMGAVLIILIAVAAYIFYERSKKQDEKSSSNVNTETTSTPSGTIPLPKGGPSPAVGGAGGEGSKLAAWTPDPKTLGELTQKGQLGPYQISLPGTFVFVPSPAALPPDIKAAQWTARDDRGVAISVVSIIVFSGNDFAMEAAKNMRQFLVNSSAGYTDGMKIKIATRGPTERGSLNGIVFSRMTFTAVAPNQIDTQGLVYGAIDGDQVVMVCGMGFGDVAHTEIRVIESVIATLNKV
jgi:hypothetical protein